MYDLEQSTVKRDMLSETGLVQTTTNWEFRKPVGCEPSTPGTPGAGAKTKRCVFQQGSKWSKQKYNWRERWKEPGNYIPKFWLAHLSWKKTNDWSKVGSPFFFEVFGRINEPRNPMILLSVPMRRACRFFLFWSCNKIQAQTWLVRAIPLEVWDVWCLSGLVHQPSIVSLLWQAPQPKPPRVSSR